MASSIKPSLLSLSFAGTACFGVLLSSSYSCCRFSLFHLASGVPNLQSFSLRTSELLKGKSGSISVNAAESVAKASVAARQENALEWSKKDEKNAPCCLPCWGLGQDDKILHRGPRMKLLRKRDIPEERYTNAFLGYGPKDSHFVIEVTYNYGVDKYDIGAGFGHFGVAVDDASYRPRSHTFVSGQGEYLFPVQYILSTVTKIFPLVSKTVDLIKAKGGKVTLEPGPVKGGKTVIAFMEVPDGYKFELLERGPAPESLCQVMLCVGDLDRSIEFYEKAYGMELLRRQDNHEYKYIIAMMGYGPEDKNAVRELTYNYSVTEYDKGDAYAQIAIGTDDVYRTAETIKLFGGKITREPRPLPGISTKITACVDPDGWKTVLPSGWNSLFMSNFY